MTSRRRNQLLATLAVVGVLGSLAALGVFGLFSATTQNAGNEIRTGTVALADNDAGTAMFNIEGAQPGDSWTRCIKVTYSGSLDSEIRTYLDSTPGPLTPYLHMKFETGTQATPVFPNCTGFNLAEEVYDGLVSSAIFPDFENGLESNPNGQEDWHSGDSQVYRITMSLDSSAPNITQGATTGVADVIWEARS